jgi:hypothetical protein
MSQKSTPQQARHATKEKGITEGAAAAKMHEFLGEAPLAIYDNRAKYDMLEAGIIKDFSPMDFVTMLLVRECAEFTYEAMRIRQAMASIVNVEAVNAMHWLYAKVVKPDLARHSSYMDKVSDLHRQSIMKHPETIPQILAAGLGPSCVQDQARFMRQEDLEVLEAQLFRVLNRRDATLDKLDQRRAALATRLKAASDATLKEASE